MTSILIQIRIFIVLILEKLHVLVEQNDLFLRIHIAGLGSQFLLETAMHRHYATINTMQLMA